jgi:predicted DNA-binding transcriptional regulator AlpA
MSDCSPSALNPHCNVLRLAEVLKRISVSKATLLRSLDRGEFPAPIVIGKRCRGWIEADLIAWLNQRRQHGEGMGVSLTG